MDCLFPSDLAPLDASTVAFTYTGMTAANVRRPLIDEKGYGPDDLPADRTMRRMLNRFGFRLDRAYRLGVRLRKAGLRPYCGLKWGIVGPNWANCRQP